VNGPFAIVFDGRGSVLVTTPATRPWGTDLAAAIHRADHPRPRRGWSSTCSWTTPPARWYDRASP